MIEFIGENCEKVFKKLELSSAETLVKRPGVEVYRLTDNDFIKLLLEDHVKDDKIWWRFAKYSTLGIPHKQCLMSGDPFLAWGDKKSYPNLRAYLKEAHGIVSFKDSSAILADLATYNHMPIHALIERYIPDAPKKGKKNHAVADSEQPEE